MKKVALILVSSLIMLNMVGKIKGADELPKYGCELVAEPKCSGNGECLEDGNCFCNEGYMGETCETSISFIFTF